MEHWWKHSERVLSVTALLVSVVSFVMSYRLSQHAAVSSVMPVLAFVYDKESQWVIQNLGNGPALNVVIASKMTDDSPWSNPVRLPPLARDGRFKLPVDINVKWLGASYNDVDGRDYSATCVRDDSRVRRGRLLPRWPNEEIKPHWTQ